MRSLLVSAMLRLFDFPDTLAPLTPFNFGHPVTAGQKENGHSISEGIKSLNKKQDHLQRVVMAVSACNTRLNDTPNPCRPANLRARLKEDLAEIGASFASARRQILRSSK